MRLNTTFKAISWNSIAVFLIISLVHVPGKLCAQSTTYISEDFSSNTKPTDWVLDSAGTSVSAGTCQDDSTVFSFDCSAYPASSAGGRPAGFDQNVAVIDVDNVGGAASTADSLYCIVTDTVNTTGSGKLELRFDWEHESFVNTGTFEVDVWDGSAWQEVFSQGPDGSGREELDVSNYRNANLRVRFCFNTDGSTSSNIWGSAVDNISLVNITCPSPSNLAVQKLTTDSVKFSWESGDSSQLNYIAFLGGAKTDTLVTTDTSGAFSGLNPNASYSLEVREVCNATDTSIATKTVNFFTPCNAFSAKFFAGFDSATAQLPIPAGRLCWDTAGNESGQIELVTGTTNNDTDPPVSAPNKVTFNDADLTNGDTALLISPELSDLNTYEQRLRFQVAFEDTGDSRLFVGVMEDPGKTGSITLLDTLTARSDQPDGTWQEFIVNFDDSTLITTADDYFFIANGDGLFESSIDNINYETIPTCLKPLNLKATNVTSDSATLKWNTQDSGSNWLVSYDTGSFKPGKGAKTRSASDSSIALKGLTENQAYKAYVRQVCQNGDTSFYSSPVSFLTPCLAFQAPYQEKFDSQPAASPFGDRRFCWTTLGNEADQINLAANNSGNNTDTPPSPPNKVTFNDAAFTNGDTSLLVSPELTGIAKMDKRITVQVAFEDLNDSRLFFGVMDSSQKASTFTITDTLTPKTGQAAGAFRQFSLLLTDTNLVDSQHYVAFANGDGTFESSIDNIVYETIPPCPSPDQISVTSRTDTSVSLKWRSNGNGNKWVVSYDTAGFQPDSGRLKGGISDTFTTITGLRPNTLYEAYPREICQRGDTGNFVNAITFRTLCDTPAPVVLPYHEGFESFSGSFLKAKQFCGKGNANWGFRSDDSTGRLRFDGMGLTSAKGLKAATLDKASDTGLTANNLVLTLNMSNYTNKEPYVLTFDQREYQDSFQSNDSLWIRGNRSASWVGLYNLNQTSKNTYQQVGPLNISKALKQAGQAFTSTFQVRFGQAGDAAATGSPRDGRAFDNVRIGQPDVAVTSLPEPSVICGLSGSETVRVSVTNTGLDTVPGSASLKLGYQVDTTTYPSQTVNLNQPLAPGDSIVSPLNQPFDLSKADTTYQWKVWVSWSEDVKSSNDTGSFSLKVPDPNLRVDNILDTAATAKWKTTQSTASTQVIFGQTGFNPKMGGRRSTTSKQTLTLKGLTKATSYDVYIRERCQGGDTGALRGPVTFQTRDAANDLRALRMNEPMPRCGLTSGEKVSVVLVNFGFDTIPANTNFQLAYQKDNQPTVLENVSLNNALNPSDTFIYTFNQTVDLSSQGQSYTIRSWVIWSSDQNANNDTAGKRLYASVVPAAPAVSNDTVCKGEPATLSVMANNKMVNWYADTSGTLLLKNSSTFGITPQEDTTLYVRVFNDPDSCKSPYTPVQAFVSPVPSVSFQPDTACTGRPLNLDGQVAINQGSIQQFQWDLGDGRSSKGKQVQPVYQASGVYQVTFSAISDQGCRGEAQQPVRVKAKPKANFASDTACFGTNLTLTENADPQGSAITSFEWNLGNGQSANGAAIQPDYSSPGNYNVELVVESANQCKDTTRKPLALLPVPEAAFTVPEGCEGETLAFTNQTTFSGIADLNYQWLFGDDETSQQPNPTHAYELYGKQNPRLVAYYDSLGNTCWDTAGKTLTIGQKVEASFTVDKKGNGTVIFIPDNAAANQYLWDFGNGDTAQVTSPEYTYNTTGTYTVTLSTVTKRGCGNVDSQEVTIETVGLDDHAQRNRSLRVYPNPLPQGHALTLQYQWEQNEEGLLSISDLSGKVVHKTPINHQTNGLQRFRLHLPNNLKAGVYVLKLQLAGKVFQREFVITPY